MIKRLHFSNGNSRVVSYVIRAILLAIVLLCACTSFKPTVNEGNGTCHSEPFATLGFEVEIPLVPLTMRFDTNGIKFNIEPGISIDLYVVEIKPYATFESMGNPTSSCLKIVVQNPQWGGDGTKKYYVNFDKQDVFQVRVKTDEYTEFVFSKDRWLARTPGKQDFINYEYSSNTLFINAADRQIDEVIITPEVPAKSRQDYFCLYGLPRNSNGFYAHPLMIVPALFQDITNSTRDLIINLVGVANSSVLMILTFLFGLSFIIKRLLAISKKGVTVKTFFLSLSILFWVIFWLNVYFANPACLVI
jgi:hypothetical protein